MSHADLTPPYGGRLTGRQPTGTERPAALERAARLPRLRLSERSVCDAVCLGSGAYSPLAGFMSRADYAAVLEDMRLTSGLIWPIPITLPVTPDERSSLRGTDAVALEAPGGSLLGILDVDDVFETQPQREAEIVYRTTDPAHPGVAAVLAAPPLALAGPVTLLNAPDFGFPDEYRTPAQTRAMFKDLGWKTVVGFQTRNPVHRAHEYLQKVAMETVDGLLLHPLVGLTKDDDIPAGVRMACYRTLLAKYYPPRRVVLSIFPAAMRYAGPREAVLHAIARKNYGCSHFIVGRDHAGVGSYYGTFDAQRMFDDIEDELGITILRFDNASWCNVCEAMVTDKTCPHGASDRVTLSGTKVREMLRSGRRPPQEFSRPEVADILIAAMAHGEKTSAG
jgi:sulfate adenylyltransferase